MRHLYQSKETGVIRTWTEIFLSRVWHATDYAIEELHAEYKNIKAYELQVVVRHPQNHRLLIIYLRGPGK